MRNCLARKCCHCVLVTHLEAHGESSTTGIAAPQSQASPGWCPSTSTKALSECRPAKVPRTLLFDVAGCNSAALPCLWQQFQRQKQPLIFTSLHVSYGLRCSVCLSGFGRGRVPSYFRQSVDVSGVCWRRTRAQPMMEIRVLGKP